MNRMLVASLSTSVVGIFMIYLAAANVEVQTMKIGDVTPDLVGRTVSVDGTIKTEKLNADGHMFLTITDGRSSIQVPVFSNVMQFFTEDNFKVKNNIQVTGLVDEYKGQLQIVPRKQSDVSFSDSN